MPKHYLTKEEVVRKFKEVREITEEDLVTSFNLGGYLVDPDEDNVTYEAPKMVPCGREYRGYAKGSDADKDMSPLRLSDLKGYDSKGNPIR